ncbi:hypothetical protein VNO78_25506 [Psophocarpus tetragonolobus]|uniref:Uncharacterized protein n=1 Tax=Psophocarpus tetragonolobus TaxID=3891 RepID=A0AAN9XFH2_PSOTE
MDYSGYNYQQSQQHSYAYDPSQIQIQPYDQTYAYQQYYGYNPQYAYFPATHQTQFQFQPEPAPLHPPGVNPTAPDPLPLVCIAVENCKLKLSPDTTVAFTIAVVLQSIIYYVLDSEMGFNSL